MDTSGRKGSDMNIFSLFTLCGGLAFFLYGMTVMSKSLEKMAGGKLERLLKRMTSNPIKSLLLGAGITIAIQSSSAMTVMLVGLVNSGVMEIGQTIGIIMGSESDMPAMEPCMKQLEEFGVPYEVKVASAQGLADCKKMLMLAKAGKYNGYLLEGMGCPGGCIAGAGTLADPARTATLLTKYKKDAPIQHSADSDFKDYGKLLHD